MANIIVFTFFFISTLRSIFKTVKRNRVTADVSVTLKDTQLAQVNVDEITHTCYGCYVKD